MVSVLVEQLASSKSVSNTISKNLRFLYEATNLEFVNPRTQSRDVGSIKIKCTFLKDKFQNCNTDFKIEKSNALTSSVSLSTTSTMSTELSSESCASERSMHQRVRDHDMSTPCRKSRTPPPEQKCLKRYKSLKMIKCHSVPELKYHQAGLYTIVENREDREETEGADEDPLNTTADFGYSKIISSS